MSKTQADFQRALAEIRSQPSPARDIGADLAEIRGEQGLTPAERRSRFILRRNEMGRQNDLDQAALDEEPTYAQKALGGVASLVRDIPGAELLQAGARSLVRRQSYDEALEDIRSAEDAAPAVVRNTNRAIGAGLGYAAMPNKIPGSTAPISHMARGAIHGALQGATDADPEADRGTGTIVGGLVGGALGAAGDVGGAGGSALWKMLRKQAAKEGKTARALWNALRNGKQPSARPVSAAPNAAPRPAAVAPPATPAVAPSTGAVPQSNTAARVAPVQRGTPAKTVDEQLNALVKRMRGEQPHEIGNVWGDAEIAQGLHIGPADLEALLRQSLKVRP